MDSTRAKAFESMVLELDFGAGLPQAKRCKIGQACRNCRIKKSKCDGIRPVCGSCALKKPLSDTCTWEERPFEQQINRASGQVSLSVQKSEDEIRSKVLLEPEPSFDQSTPSRSYSIPYCTPYSNEPHQASPTMSEQSDGKDAMGNIDSEGLRTGILGTSSSQSFMKSMVEMAERDMDQNRVTMPSRKQASISLRRKWNSSSCLPLADYVLPQRKTADRLLQIHWEKSQIIFPWLDPVEFNAWYEGLWIDVGRDVRKNDNVHHCMLNTIFAISYKLDTTIPPEEQETLANNHFMQAERLLSTNLLDLCHLELIQALLLMGQYLQSTCMPHQCLQSISLAIWIARNLDLHLPNAIQSISDTRERELAHRIWQGCILFDRVMSMTLGKPLLINQATARVAQLPAMWGNDQLNEEWNPSLSAHPSVYFSFFVAYCQLHILLGDILETFYSNRAYSQSQAEDASALLPGRQNIDELLAFDDAIESWRNELPTHLKMSSNRNDLPVFRRQAASLTLRTLHIRMLLFRAFFSYSHTMNNGKEKSSHEHRFADGIKKDGLITCTTYAQSIIDIIASQCNGDAEANLLPPYWHVIAYTHTAATVVIAAHLHFEVVQYLDATALAISLRRAFDILQRYENDRSAARKCKAVLGALCDKIMAYRNRAHAPARADELETAKTLTNMVQPMGPVESFLDADFWNIEDDTDMLWLNSAPFDSNNNHWL